MLKQNKTLVLVISILLALVVLLLAVLGTVSLVRSSRAVYSYRGQIVDRGEYAYFASVYKNQFMRECVERGVVGVADTSFFWSRVDQKSGKTYGEAYLAGLDTYVRTLLIAADLYDSSIGMDKVQRKEFRATVSAVLEDRADGDKRAFDRETAIYGFTFSDFEDAALLEYKRARLFRVLASDATETVASMTQLCDEFYEMQYSRVKMIFIRTEDVFCYDEEGNRLTDEQTGEDMTRTLTAEEKLAREADIALLRDAIAKREGGEDGAMTTVMFDLFADRYERDGDSSYKATGYYFATGEQFTKEMQEAFGDIVNNALQMQDGEYRVIDCDTQYFQGSCVLYATANEDGAYSEGTLSTMFSDFYSGAAQYYVLKNVEGELSSVETGRRMGEISPLEIPRNYYFVAGF